MPTITTLRPFNLNDGFVPTTDEIAQSMYRRIYNILKGLPYFNNHFGEYTETAENYKYRINIDTAIGGKFIIGMDSQSNNNNKSLAMYYTYQASSNNDLFIYISPYTFHVVDLQYDRMNRFNMTTVITENSNGFWLDGDRYNTYIAILKAINIEDPTRIEYHPAFFMYDTHGQTNSGNYAGVIPTSNLGGDPVFTNTCIYNGYIFENKQNISRYKDGYSKTYNIRQFINSEWMYPDLYVLEGGIIPVYNTRQKIKYGNTEYMYLSNRFMLKLS
jgi:hypothetical protein